MRADRSRRGSAILEAVVAMVMLAVAGTALITLLGQTRHSMWTLRNSERTTRAASEQIERLILLDRVGLSALEGTSRINDWSVHVTQVGAALFDVSVARTDTSAALLSTTLYRPDSANAIH